MLHHAAEDGALCWCRCTSGSISYSSVAHLAWDSRSCVKMIYKYLNWIFNKWNLLFALFLWLIDKKHICLADVHALGTNALHCSYYMYTYFMSFYFYDQILSFRFKLFTIALMGIHLMHIYCVCTAADAILLWYWHSFSSVWTAALKLCTILRPELNFFKQIHNQETITAVNHCEQENDCIVVCYWFFYDFKSMFSSFGMLLPEGGSVV